MNPFYKRHLVPVSQTKENKMCGDICAHFSAVGCFLVKRLPDLERDGGGGDEALLLEGHGVSLVLADSDDRGCLVAQGPGSPAHSQGGHERVKVLALVQLELAKHVIADSGHLDHSLEVFAGQKICFALVTDQYDVCTGLVRGAFPQAQVVE